MGSGAMAKSHANTSLGLFAAFVPGWAGRGAASLIAAPHFEQKAASGATSVPHFEQKDMIPPKEKAKPKLNQAVQRMTVLWLSDSQLPLSAESGLLSGLKRKCRRFVKPMSAHIDLYGKEDWL